MSANAALQRLSQALSQIVSGVYVMTLRDPDKGPQAVVLSFVQQVGLDPPRIVAAIAKERPILAMLDRAGHFVLNIWADGHQGQLARIVESSDQPAKALKELGARDVGSGYVLDPVSAYLSCKVVERVDIGDHWLYIADVTEGVTMEGRTPLVHIRRSGLRY